MSTKNPGGFVTKNPLAPTTTAASGMWTLDQVLQYSKNNTWPIAASYDPYWSNVVLSLPMDGSNGGTTFTDVSPTPKAMSATNATTSTTNPKFGTACGSFNGTSAYVQSTTNPAGNITWGPSWTVEGWFKTSTTGAYQTLVSDYGNNGGADLGWITAINNTNVLRVFRGGTTTLGTTVVTDGQWHHFAVCFTSTNTIVFLDGRLEISAAGSGGTSSSGAISGPLGLSCGAVGFGGTSQYFNGYMDSIRVTNGIQRYTNNFTPLACAYPTYAPPTPNTATGGTITYANGRTIHTFTGNGTFTPSQSISADYLVVAGGGGGGGGNTGNSGSAGSGGGAGGLLSGTSTLSATGYSIVVGTAGSGGAAGLQGTSGGNSTFNALTAVGGGGGGGGYSDTLSSGNGLNGGSGGGRGGCTTTSICINGTGTAGQGYDGGSSIYRAGNGGGGASAVGGNATSNSAPANGGAGVQSSISGTATYYAGGGGGGAWSSGGPTTGGNSVGGAGGTSGVGGSSAVANTGSGGGGGGQSNGGGSTTGGNGAGGVVVISYPTFNYATWNPSDKGTNVTLSNGNLATAITSANTIRSTAGKSSGKWYWEVICGTSSTNRYEVGVALSTLPVSGDLSVTGGWMYYGVNGAMWLNGSNPFSGATYVSGDVIGVALDATNLTVQFYKNNTLQYQATGITSGTLYPAVASGSDTVNMTINFGQNALKYTPPNGTFCNPKDATSGCTFSNNNMTTSSTGAVWGTSRTNTSRTTGKWYWEVTCSGATADRIIGIANSSASFGGNYALGSDANSWGIYSDGRKVTNNSYVAYGNSYTAGDVIGIALDITNGKLFFSKNGVWQNSGDPSAGTNAAYTTGITGTLFPSTSNQGTAYSQTLNTGASKFSYPIPTGYEAWDATVYNAGVY